MSEFVNTFLASDHHFRHRKIIEFEPVKRPFKTIEEHDEALIENHNKVVKPQDIVWFGGDLCFGNDEGLEFLFRLAGRKRLILGNHDSASKVRKYMQMGLFEGIYGSETIGRDLVIQHRPVHPGEFHRAKACIHGHLHSALVKDEHGNPDRRYFNISMEHINLTPIHFDEIKKILKERGIY